MNPTIGLDVWKTGPNGRLRVLLTLALMLLAWALIRPFADRELPVSYALFGMTVAAALVASAITAVLLILQGRTTGAPGMIVLGAGYAFVAATLVPYAALYPGLLGRATPSLANYPSASSMLWIAWHSALVAAALGFLRLSAGRADLATARRRAHRIAAGFALAYVAVVGVAVGGALPPGYADSGVDPRYRLAAILLVDLPGAVAMVLALRERRLTVLEGGIAIMVGGSILDIHLVAVALQPFTVGWWASRLVMVIVNGALLTVLLRQTTRFYTSLLQRAETLEGQVNTDALTGLANRRRFDQEYPRAFAAALRRDSPFSLAMLDLDHFKAYNDAFGHVAGDVALRRVAQTIAASAERTSDLAARYGGEEFVVILDDTDPPGARAVAERIRRGVHALDLRQADGRRLTISVGVATREEGEAPDELLGRADEALYAAKTAGRDRVEVAAGALARNQRGRT